MSHERPERSEAADYYWGYIDQAPGDDVLALLAAQRDEIARLGSAVSEERSLHRYAPDKWSIREVLNHLNDGERLFAFRAFWFARGFETPLPSFDQMVAAKAADAERTSWAAHLAEFQALRSATVDFFRGLPDAAWTRTGSASDKRFSVRAIAWIIAGHTAHHLRVLRERYGL
jgi:hypothetical protein